MDDKSLKLIKSFEPLWGSWYATEYLGGGSYGSVYKVRHMLDENDFSAVKILPFPPSQSEADTLARRGNTRKEIQEYYRKAVMNEIRIMRELQGISNIVDIKDYNIIERQTEYGYDVLIRMEYLQCFSEYYMKVSWTEEKVIKFGIDMCIALEFMEKKHYIHRDIKPDNIFVNDLGLFKLGDFGEAKRIDSAIRSKHGTPRYMAPEVMQFGEYKDSRVDIYSLGMILYEICNDHALPFYPAFPEIPTYDEEGEAIQRRCDGEEFPRPVHGSDALVQVIRKACAFRIEDRFHNATEFKDALRACLNKKGPGDTLSDFLSRQETSEPEAAGKSAIANPIIRKDTDMKSGQNVEWDLVEYGTYPQREILPYDEVYRVLTSNTNWSSDHTLTLGAERYLRCKKEDATYYPPHHFQDKEDAWKHGWYYWGEEDAYHYFLFEPIRWRVLHVEHGQALLLADQILNCKTFYELRYFLNLEFSFQAFSRDEGNLLITQKSGDKVSLMGMQDVSGQHPAAEYGFCSQQDCEDEGRSSRSSDYAKAMGLSFSKNEKSDWWLTDYDTTGGRIRCVLHDGYILEEGLPPNSGDVGIRPVILLDLERADLSIVSKITSKE